MRFSLKRTSFAVALVAAAAVALPGPAQELAIDPVHSDVGFSVSHMVISKVHGSFTKLKGAIVLDRQRPERSSVTATIDAASIDTHDAGRDKDLKSANFLDVKKYPRITFVSDAVRRNGEAWLARGKLTLHGVTREIEIPFHLTGPIKDPWGNTRIAVAAGPLTLDRRDFGIVWNKTLETGGLLVGNQVEVRIQLEAVMKK